MSEKAVRPFGIRDKLGYMFGDFGNDFTFLLSSSFLMKFYTDVMSVDAYVVGVVMMVARIVDAFTDIGMGRICDRSKGGKHGKFKPWILRMCGPVALCSFLMYQSALADMPNAAKIAYLFITYILWGSVFYTSVNIPYGSMASAISADPGDRQSLSTFRTMGGALAGAFVTAGIPLIAYDNINGNDVLNGPRFTIIAGVCSVLAVGCYLLCFNLCTERVKSTPTKEQLKRNNIGVMFAHAFTNRALLSLIVASILMLIAQLTLQQMANYVFPNYYGNAKAQTLSMVMMGVGMLAAAFAAKPLANRFGKAEMGAVSNFAAGIICIVLYFLRPQNVFVYAAFQMVSWIGLGVFQIVAWALVTDVIDYSEIKNGIREDGAVYGMYSFARKLGQAATSGLVGSLLTAVGYTDKTAFDPAVKEGIFDIATLVPAAGFLLLAVVLWFWYPLHKKQVEKDVAILAEKHAAEAQNGNEQQ